MPVQLTLPLIFEAAPAPAKINYEYFVLLSPDEAIASKLKAKKKELHTEIGLSRENRLSVAHISLFKFMDLQDEELIRAYVQQALEDIQPFTVDLNKPEVFDHGLKKSIVLTFRSPEFIRELSHRLLKEFGYKFNTLVPHLTIARSVPNRDFDRINNLQAYFFNGTFVCRKVTVLRRPLNKKARYEVFDEIDLQDTILPLFRQEAESLLAG